MGIKDQKGNSGKIRPTEDRFPLSKFNYPVFCLKYLHKDYHLNHCIKDEKIAFIEKLLTLSSMTWEQIQMAPRHGLGTEKINQSSIKASKPASVTPDVSFYALRFQGKKAMVGYKSDFIFHVVYLDRDFTLYDH